MLRPLIAALLLGGPPHSDRVSIVATNREDPVVVALSAELETLGLQARVVPEPSGTPGLEELRAIGRRDGVVAAIWIAADQTSLFIWVDDRENGRAIVRELPAPREGDEEVIVMRAVELLRASLREVQGQPEEQPEPPGPPVPQTDRPPHPLPPPPEHPLVVVELGGAIAGAAGSLGPSGHIHAGVRVRVRRGIGLRLTALAPTVGRLTRGDEGSARISVAHVLFGPHFAIRAPEKVFQPAFGVGAGLSIVRMDGRAQAPFSSRTDHVFGAVMRAGAGFARFPISTSGEPQPGRHRGDDETPSSAGAVDVGGPAGKGRGDHRDL